MSTQSEYDNWPSDDSLASSLYSQCAENCVDALVRTIAEGQCIIHPDVWTDPRMEPIFEALILIIESYPGKKLYVQPCVSDKLRVLEKEGNPGAKIAMSRLEKMVDSDLIELPSVAQPQKPDVDTILIRGVKKLLDGERCVFFLTLNAKLQRRLLSSLSFWGPEAINTYLTCPNVESFCQVCEIICQGWNHFPKPMQQQRFVQSCREHVKRVVAALKALEDDESDWPALDEEVMMRAPVGYQRDYDWSDQSLLANHPICPIVQALSPAANASPELVFTWRDFGSGVITFLLSNGVEQGTRRAVIKWLQFMIFPFLDSFAYQRYELDSVKQAAATLSRGSQISIKSLNPTVEDIDDVCLSRINDPEVRHYFGQFAAIWNDWWEKLESKKPFARIDDEALCAKGLEDHVLLRLRYRHLIHSIVLQPSTDLRLFNDTLSLWERHFFKQKE